MNWLDVVLALILSLSFIAAAWNGLSREVVRLLALVGGIVAGMWWYEDLAVHLRPHTGNNELASFAAFLSIVVGSLLAGAIVARVLGKILRWTGLRWFDRLLGAAFGLVRGLLMATAVVMAVVAFQPTAGSADVIAESRLAPWLLHGASAATSMAPYDLRTRFDEGFERVRAAWTNARPPELIKRN